MTFPGKTYCGENSTGLEVATNLLIRDHSLPYHEILLFNIHNGEMLIKDNIIIGIALRSITKIIIIYGHKHQRDWKFYSSS